MLAAPESPFTVTVLTRTDSTADFASLLGTTSGVVTVIRGDYTLETLKSAFQGQDAVISATSVFTIETIQEIILEAARATGVQRVVLNEFADSPIYQDGLPELMVYRRVKDKVREHAQRLSDESVNSDGSRSFTWSAVATGNLIDLSLKKYPIFGFDIQNRTARLVDNGVELITATTLRDIGIAVRGILLHPKETANRYIHVRSTCTSQSEILQAFRDATKEEWTVTHASSSSLLENGRKAFAAGERKGMLDLLVAQLFEKGANRSIVVPTEKSDNGLVGVQERPVIDIVRDVLGD